MALHPINDRFKVKITKKRFSKDVAGAESGIVVEVPDMLIYLSFHSFAFEDSLTNETALKKIQAYYNQFLGKRIYWESLQDRGRMIAEGDDEYVYLQMTDLLAYADDVDDKAEIVSQVGGAGSFNLS
jgi:hypothetical protein